MKSYNEILNEMDHISRYESIINRLEDEPVYLLNRSEKIVLRSVPPGDEFYAKKEKGTEYEIDYLSRTVVNAIGDAVEITKEEYEEF